jgi:hypothetical protein
MSRQQLRMRYARECREWQRKTTEGLVGLGKTLIKAKRDLDRHGDWLPFLRDDLRMDADFAQRVMALARNPRFLNTANLRFLPSALSALGVIARLSDDEFEAGKASGTIHPSMTAKQAKGLMVKRKAETLKLNVTGYVSKKPVARVRYPSPQPRPEPEGWVEPEQPSPQPRGRFERSDPVPPPPDPNPRPVLDPSVAITHFTVIGYYKSIACHEVDAAAVAAGLTWDELRAVKLKLEAIEEAKLATVAPVSAG